MSYTKLDELLRRGFQRKSYFFRHGACPWWKLILWLLRSRFHRGQDIYNFVKESARMGDVQICPAESSSSRPRPRLFPGRYSSMGDGQDFTAQAHEAWNLPARTFGRRSRRPDTPQPCVPHRRASKTWQLSSAIVVTLRLRRKSHAGKSGRLYDFAGKATLASQDQDPIWQGDIFIWSIFDRSGTNRPFSSGRKVVNSHVWLSLHK
jgi:hypothetical protein